MILDQFDKVKKERVDPNILFTPQNENYDVLFESITMPAWNYLITIEDIIALYQTVTSRKLAGNFDARKKIIDDIMKNRGFKFMAGGTNRITYKHMEIPHIVAKVPIDRVGLNDNLWEFKNQKKLWPYCTKMLQVTPYGVIGFAERVEPILNRTQFNIFSMMVYSTTLELIGKYVMEDIGTDYYKNWGIRHGFGPVILDYPYVFELDGNKLICRQPMGNGMPCMGEIDYDPGFNHLYCTRCGKMYNASELQMAISSDIIQLDNRKGGKKPMLVTIKRGDKVIATSLNSDSIVRPNFQSDQPNRPKLPSDVKVTIRRGSQVLASNDEPQQPEVIPVTVSYGEEMTTSDLKIPADEEIKLPMVEEIQKEPETEQVITQQVIDDNTVVTILQQNPDIYKPDLSQTMPEVPIVPAVVEGSVVDMKEVPKESDVIQPLVEKQIIPEEEKTEADEFPPVQWRTPQKPGGTKRRIITNSSSGDAVHRRPNNPYK